MDRSAHYTVWVVNRHQRRVKVNNLAVIRRPWKAVVPIDITGGGQRQYCRCGSSIWGGPQIFEYPLTVVPLDHFVWRFT